MTRHSFLSLCLLAALPARAEKLAFSTVFRGQDRYDALISQARPKAAQLAAMPIGERVAWFGQKLVGTPYRSFTLEIHDHIEAPCVNLLGLDCWTFFETSLAYARMAALPAEQWSPQTLLHYIEQDRYWGGRCDGTYLSRLHYLEDWTTDNQKRGYVKDLTSQLGGIHVTNAATEMTVNWRGYRYMRNSASNRAGIAKLEARLRSQPLLMIPNSRVPKIESKIQSGDVISIVTRDGGAYGTSHVGLALRKDGVLHFMHASSPRNYGKVIVDSRLSSYLTRYRSNAGIMVARPLK